MTNSSFIRRLTFSFVLGACVAPLATTPPAAHAQESPDSAISDAMEKLVSQQETAWGVDAAAWSAVFSENADFINIRGDVFPGRAAIIAQHARIFAGPFKGSHANITIRLITQAAPNLVILDTDQEVTGFAGLPPGISATAPGVLRTRMKYIAAKRGDQWVFIAAQNTAMVPAAAPPPE